MRVRGGRWRHGRRDSDRRRRRWHRDLCRWSRRRRARSQPSREIACRANQAGAAEHLGTLAVTAESPSPDRIIGENGEVGYSYTTGTAGGAAYAIALGSKPRRPAEVSLVTYHGGEPVGIQWVTLQTNGDFEIGNYVPLHLPEDPPDVVEETDPPGQPAD